MRCPKCHFTFTPLIKHRTTGKYSQCNHLHGHLQQIGKEVGYSMEEIKSVMKEDCIDWPRKQVVFRGKHYMVPISESEADTVAESAAIEWAHMRAAELNITLIEDGV